VVIEQKILFILFSGNFIYHFYKDGNLVIYDSTGQAIWHSGLRKRGTPNYQMSLNDDSNLYLYDKFREVLWRSIGILYFFLKN
jgi:hypothetical protein